MGRHLTKSRILGYAVCLVLATASIASVSYARYHSEIAGTGIASVAAFAGDTTINLSVSDLAPGETKTVEFQVVNYKDSKISEVTQSYSISIETSGNLPIRYALKEKSIDGGGTPAGGFTDETRTTASNGTLPHTNKAIHLYTLTLEWPAAQNAPDFMFEIENIRLIIHSEQVL